MLNMAHQQHPYGCCLIKNGNRSGHWVYNGIIKNALKFKQLARRTKKTCNYHHFTFSLVCKCFMLGFIQKLFDISKRNCVFLNKSLLFKLYSTTFVLNIVSFLQQRISKIKQGLPMTTDTQYRLSLPGPTLTILLIFYYKNNTIFNTNKLPLENASQYRFIHQHTL